MTRSAFFSVTDGWLEILSSRGKAKRVRPDGLEVQWVATYGAHRLLVMLLPVASTGRVRNLVMLEADGEIAWRAELPSHVVTDSFTTVRLDAGNWINATTWSGYSVMLDPETGRIVHSTFVK